MNNTIKTLLFFVCILVASCAKPTINEEANPSQHQELQDIPETQQMFISNETHHTIIGADTCSPCDSYEYKIILAYTSCLYDSIIDANHLQKASRYRARELPSDDCSGFIVQDTLNGWVITEVVSDCGDASGFSSEKILFYQGKLIFEQRTHLERDTVRDYVFHCLVNCSALSRKFSMQEFESKKIDKKYDTLSQDMTNISKEEVDGIEECFTRPEFRYEE